MPYYNTQDYLHSTYQDRALKTAPKEIGAKLQNTPIFKARVL